MKYELIDCCPVPSKLAPVLRQLKKDSGCSFNSVYRGKDARALLRQCGKMDQDQLYQLYLQGRGNPANPPGRSTHELRNDGAAYRGYVGMPLRYWQVGMDINNPQGFIRAAARRGFTATVTYPYSRLERHHVNLRKEPKFNVVKPLRLGDKGRRVKTLTRRLAFARRPDGKSRYLPHKYITFTKSVETALKEYQIDHHQKPDGIYGTQTRRQLDASVRYWKQREKENKAKK